MIYNNSLLKSSSGLVFAVPIPEEFVPKLPVDEFESVIVRSAQEAKQESFIISISKQCLLGEMESEEKI